MKLTKDQIQKLCLSGLLLCAFLYFFVTFMMEGLAKTERSNSAREEELTPKIRTAETQVKESARLEAEAPAALDRMAELKARIPEGSPLAWYPPKITEFFKRHNIAISTPRLVRDQVDFGVPGLVRMIWTIEIPEVDAVSLGITLAGLENEDPLSRVDSIQIAAGAKDAEYQHATVTLATTVRK